MTARFPLATTSWDEKEAEALQRVIASGNFTMGEHVATFERDFADYVGSRYCVMVNSGSSANLLMVAALFYHSDPTLRLSRGDEVIVPAVSWSTTYHPLYQYGLKLRFVDIDMATLNIDIGKLEAALTDRTRLLMSVNLLGNPCDYRAIAPLLAARGVTLIEDNCESLGATLEGRQAGTFGVMGSYSSFFSHHISTMEGGMIVTEDEELYHLLLSLRAHGWTRQLPKHNRICAPKGDDPFEESFRFVLPGYNVRPLEMSGALGIEQVRKLPALIAGRQANGRLLQERLGNHPHLMIQQEVGESSWFGFSLVIRPGSDWTRPELVKRLSALGFEVRPIVAGNFAKNEVVTRYFDHSFGSDLGAAEHIDRQGMFVGNHPYPIPDTIEALASL